MALGNPKILKFDIGFQLSFLALIGIVYLMPAVKKFFKVNDEKGILDWKENFLTTVSAQLAVISVLIRSFSNFSFISIVANVLILGFIPYTMTLGFILGAIGFISYPLSLVFGWFVHIFLSYEIFVINFFGKINFFQIKNMSVILMFVYYLALSGFVIYMKKPARQLGNFNGGRSVAGGEK